MIFEMSVMGAGLQRDLDRMGRRLLCSHTELMERGWQGEARAMEKTWEF